MIFEWHEKRYPSGKVYRVATTEPYISMVIEHEGISGWTVRIGPNCGRKLFATIEEAKVEAYRRGAEYARKMAQKYLLAAAYLDAAGKR